MSESCEHPPLRSPTLSRLRNELVARGPVEPFTVEEMRAARETIRRINPEAATPENVVELMYTRRLDAAARAAAAAHNARVAEQVAEQVARRRLRDYLRLVDVLTERWLGTPVALGWSDDAVEREVERITRRAHKVAAHVVYAVNEHASVTRGPGVDGVGE